MLQSGSKLPRVGATRKKKEEKRMLSIAMYELCQSTFDCIQNELRSSHGYAMTAEPKLEGYVSRARWQDLGKCLFCFSLQLPSEIYFIPINIARVQSAKKHIDFNQMIMR
jgi:hypothetical protein